MANPNPSPETRFKPGNSFGGKTSEQRRLEYEAAEMAAKARHKMLTVITEKLDGIEAQEMSAEDIVKMVEANILKLFKDSEDRAHGTPKQSVDHTSSDQTMTPVSGLDIKVVNASKSDTDGTTG